MKRTEEEEGAEESQEERRRRRKKKKKEKEKKEVLSEDLIHSYFSILVRLTDGKYSVPT